MITRFFAAVERIFAPIAGPIDARLNPIVAKEIRQALRGKYFAITFILMVLVATVVGSIALVLEAYDPSDSGGVTFFLWMYGCLSVSVHLFVPFAAYLSVGAEWEENTFDLLVLSNLRPRQIVLGKLASSFVQILLFYCAFGPFLVFAFLLRGLDLAAAGWVLGFTLATSTCLTCVALCLSSLVRHKFARVLIMALQAAILIGACVGSVAVTIGILQEGVVHVPEFVMSALAFLSGVTVVSAFALVFAATRFAHVEENRSTPLRVLTTAVVVAAVAWMSHLFRSFREPEILVVLAVMTLVGSWFVSTVLCVENERLGRRATRKVSPNRMLALASVPFLPGGGRGVLHFLLNSALVGSALVVLPVVVSHSRNFEPEIPATFFVFTAIYLLIPTALMAGRDHSLVRRFLAAILVPITALVGFIVPTIVGYLIGNHSMANWEHIGNFVWVVEQVDRWDDVGPFVLVAVIALGALLLNVPRTYRGVREVLAASSARRAEAKPSRVEAVSASPDAGA